ncbi:MAG: TetR/AcrR family transcriptional regulator [Nitrospirae bacterium]|jgi:TetR/AcrR family transcriptional repressor of nem operon|nr:TetR/AcrR family transcriptional regulator [Nitrospirota bacterium]
METPDTTDRILDAAQDLVQSRGFNAFSYRDVAEKIHIRTASIHYHFPKKDDLALALIRRYHERFLYTLRQIGQGESRPENRLAAYMELFSDLSSRGERLCLFAVFSADATSLSEDVQAEIRSFYDTNVDWIANVIERGRQAGSFAFSGSSPEMARGIFALLEGEILVRRAFRKNSGAFSVPPVVRALLSWGDDRPAADIPRPGDTAQ